ncbi:MAG: LCP family protein [Anaerovoracaceae bacterium]
MEPVPSIVDEIGGIKIDVDTKMYDPDYNISINKGIQEIDGRQAMLYLQWRNSSGGDIDRIKHVQNFISTLYKQQKNSGKIIETLKIILKYRDDIQTNFSNKQLLSFAVFINQLSDDLISYYTLSGSPKMIDGISYWIPEDNVEVLNEFFEVKNQL